MGASEDKFVEVHMRKNFKKKEKFHHNKKDKKQTKTKRDTPNVRCDTCDEKGHFGRDCPMRKKRCHAHIVEDDEPTNKIFRQENNDSHEEYVLIAALTGILSQCKEK